MPTRSTVVVTGASVGIGRAIARAFGQEGERVALLGQSGRGLGPARSEVERPAGSGVGRF